MTENYFIDSSDDSPSKERCFRVRNNTNLAGQEKINNFAAATPHHPSPKQGFFDTLDEGRGFGRKERRFHTTKDGIKTVIVMSGGENN